MTLLPYALLSLSLISGVPETAAPASRPTTVELPAPLDRVLRDYERAWRSRDSKALAALFADDGFVLSGGRPPIQGADNIERHYQGKGGPLTLRAFAFGMHGPVAYILGAYGRTPAEDAGKFTLTLKKGTDGRWRIVSDMDNGNQRPKRRP